MDPKETNGSNSEEQQRQSESNIRPTLLQVKKSWGFRRSTLARREFMEEVGDLSHSPPVLRRGRSRRANQTPETTTESHTIQRATQPTRSVIDDLEWSAPSSPVSEESKTGLEAPAAGSLDPSLWQDFGSAFHTAFSLLGGNEGLSIDMPGALANPYNSESTGDDEALSSQAIDEAEESDVMESVEVMNISLPVASDTIGGGENDDVVIISSQEDSDEMTLIQIKEQLASKGRHGDTRGKGGKGRTRGKGRGRGRGRGKGRGRGRGRARAVKPLSSIIDEEESDDEVMLVDTGDQQQKQLQEAEKTNHTHTELIEMAPNNLNTPSQCLSSDCIIIDAELDQIPDVIPGQYEDASEEKEEQDVQEVVENKKNETKIVTLYSNTSDPECFNPDALCCICRQKHNKRFMICCDICKEWFHTDCVDVSETQGRQIEKIGQEYICPTCKTKKEHQTEPDPQPEPELNLSKCLTLSSSEEEGEGQKDQEVPKETVGEEEDRKATVKKPKPDPEAKMNIHNSLALCIGPGCLKQALPDSGYCSTECILQHAAATMKALSGPTVPKSKGRAQKKATSATPIAKVQKSTRTSKRLAGKAKEEGEEELTKEEDGGPTGAEASLACDLNLTEVETPCIPSSQFNTVSKTDFKEVEARSEAVSPSSEPPEDPAAVPSMQLVTEPSPLQKDSLEKAKESVNQSAQSDLSNPTNPAISPPSPVEQSTSNSASPPHESGAPMITKATYVIPKKQVKAQPPPSSQISCQKPSSTPVLLNEPRNLPVPPAPSAPSSRPSQPNNQVRQSIQRSLTSILSKRLSDCEDLEMSDSDVTKLVASIEMEMFNIFRNTDSKYMNKYRTIMFNIKDPKNKGLLYRVVHGDISPFRLVRMSQKDMQATKAPEPRAKDTEAKDTATKAPALLLKPEAVKVNLPSLPITARPDRRPDRKPDSTVAYQEQKRHLPGPALKTRTIQPNQGRAAPDILTCMLKDTTSEHKAHLFDVKCKICTGQIAEDEGEPAKKKNKFSEKGDKHEPLWRQSAGDSISLQAPPDSPDIDPASRLIIDSPILTIVESPASPSIDSPASPILDSPASPVMGHPASPTHGTSNPRKPKRAYIPVVIPAVSTVTITRRDPRTAASRFSAGSVSVSSHTSTSHSKTSAVIPVKEASSAMPLPPASSLPSIKIAPKSILMKPSSSADPRLFRLASRSMISESTADGETAQFLAKQEILWKGFLNMLTVAKFVTKGYLVSGCAENIKMDLPDTIQIGGRIMPQTVWDYVAKLKTSVTKELCVIRFHPATEEEDVAYVSLFSYFSSRGRFGVVSNNSNSIKDLYLVPLSAKESIPSILQPLVGPGLENKRPNLLLGLAIIQKAKRLEFLSQEEETRPSVYMAKDPAWIPKPPALYGSDKLDVFQPYDPETPGCISPSGSPSYHGSPTDSSFSVFIPSLCTSTETNPQVSTSVVAASQSISSSISDKNPSTAQGDKSQLKTILKTLIGNKENDSTDSCDASSKTVNDKKMPVFSQKTMVDPIVQQFGQKSKVKAIEQEENDCDRPYDPEEEYDPGIGYGMIISQNKEKKKIDAPVLPGSVDDDVAYDPEDETIFEDIQSDRIVTKPHVQTFDSPSSPPLSSIHVVAPPTTSTPAQTSTTATLMSNLPTGTVVVSAATLTEQQRMLEELNKQIEEQKRQLKEQEEALRQQREAVGMFMAHFSVSDSLMSPPSKSMPLNQQSSQMTDKTSNPTETAHKSNENLETPKQDETITCFKNTDTATANCVQVETQDIANEPDKYSSAGEIEDSDVAYDPEDESLFNEIQEDVFQGSSMKTCDSSLPIEGHSVDCKGSSPNSHHSRKRRLSPKRRGHHDRDHHRSPSRRSQRRSPSHSRRHRERDRHRRSERDRSRRGNRDQSERQTRHRKEHTTRRHSRGYKRSPSSPRKKHSVSLSPKKNREPSRQDHEQLNHTGLLCHATSFTILDTSVTIKNEPDEQLKCGPPNTTDNEPSSCSIENSEKTKHYLVNDDNDIKGSFSKVNKTLTQETQITDKLDTPVPLREIEPPIRDSPESPDPEPQFVKHSEKELGDSIKTEQTPEIQTNAQLPLVKVENNSLCSGEQAKLSNTGWSTLAFKALDRIAADIIDQSIVQPDKQTKVENLGLNHTQIIGQQGSHSQQYTCSDIKCSKPEIDCTAGYSRYEKNDLENRGLLRGDRFLGPEKVVEGLQGIFPVSASMQTIKEPHADAMLLQNNADMQGKNTHGPGLQWRNEQIGQNCREPIQSIKNFDYKGPVSGFVVPNMVGQTNQMDPTMKDLDWSGQESDITGEWRGNDKRGSYSVRGRPFIENEWREPEREGPAMDKMEVGMGGQGIESTDVALKGLGTERRGTPVFFQGPGPHKEGQGHDIRGPPGPGYRGPWSERDSPEMLNPEANRRVQEGQVVWGPGTQVPALDGPDRNGPGPDFKTGGHHREGIGIDQKELGCPDFREQWTESRRVFIDGPGLERGSPGCPDFRGAKLERKSLSMECPGTDRLANPGPNVWVQGQDPGPISRGFGGPTFIESGSERRCLSMRAQAPNSRKPEGPGFPRPERDWGESGAHEYKGQGHERRGPFLDNEEIDRRGLDPEFKGQEHENRVLVRRGPEGSDFKGPGCEKGAPSFQGRWPNRIGPDHQNSGVPAAYRREPYIGSAGPEISSSQMEGPIPYTRERIGPEGRSGDIGGLGSGARDTDIRGPALECHNRNISGSNFMGSMTERRHPNMDKTEDNCRLSGGSQFRGAKQGRRPPEVSEGKCSRGPDFRGLDTVGSGPYSQEQEGSGFGELEWGGPDFRVQRPMLDIEKNSHLPRGPRPMRRKIRGRGKDFRGLNQGDGWKVSERVEQWPNRREPNMEIAEMCDGNWKRHGNRSPDEHCPDFSRHDHHGDWRGHEGREAGPIQERSNRQFQGPTPCPQDDWSGPGWRVPGPIHDDPNMVYPGPNRRVLGNEWKESNKGLFESDRRGPGPFFRGETDPDNGRPGHNKIDLAINDPGIQGRFSGCRRLGSERLGGRPGPGRQGFEQDFRRPKNEPNEPSDLNQRPGDWDINTKVSQFDKRGTTMIGQGLDSWGSEQPLWSDMEASDIGCHGPTRDLEMRHREQRQRGQTNINEGNAELRHFDEPGLRNFSNIHQAGRFQNRSHQNSAPFNRPPAPNSGFDSQQNAQAVKPQRYRAALLPTPKEGLIRFPNGPSNNSNVFSIKKEETSHYSDREWSRDRPVIRNKKKLV